MSVDGARVCMFCGAAGLTKTHLVAQRSIRRHLPAYASGVARADLWLERQGYASNQRSFDMDPLSHQVKRACADCNGRWMRDIENDVAETVIALAKGEQRTLDSGEAARLALWATAVAMLRTTQDPGEPTFDPADARALRRTSELPTGYVVWLLHGEPRWDFASRHQRIVASFGGRPMEPGHVTWFWVGRAVYMVTHPVVAPALSGMNVLGDAVQILAPYGDYPIEWPFRAAVTYATLMDVTSTVYGE